MRSSSIGADSGGREVSEAAKAAARRQAEAARREAARKTQETARKEAMRVALGKPQTEEPLVGGAVGDMDKPHVDRTSSDDQLRGQEDKATRAKAIRAETARADAARRDEEARERAARAAAIRAEKVRKAAVREEATLAKEAKLRQERLQAAWAQASAERRHRIEQGDPEEVAREADLMRQARAQLSQEHEQQQARRRCERFQQQQQRLQQQQRAQHEQRLKQQQPQQQQQQQQRRGGTATPDPVDLDPTARPAFSLPTEAAALVSQVLQLQSCPWSCLGLPRRTPAELARKRYLQLALRLHPDKCKHRQARTAFVAAERAYRSICRRQAAGCKVRDVPRWGGEP